MDGPAPTSTPHPPASGSRRRVAAAFLCLALGLAIGRGAGVAMPMLWFSLACAAMAMAGAARGRVCAAALGCATLLLGAGWYDLRIHAPMRDPLEAMLASPEALRGRGVLLTVEGVVQDDPTEKPKPRDGLARFRRDERAHRFVFSVSGVESPGGLLASGSKLWVRVLGDDPPAVRAGERVRLTGIARGLEAPLNPGEADIRVFARQSNFAGLLVLTSSDLIVGLSPGTSVRDRVGRAVLQLRAMLRARASGALASAFPSEADHDAAALARGLLLGDPEVNDLAVRQTFTRLGLAHVLSISGFHLSVMALVSLTLLRLTGDRGWLEPALVAMVVVAYALIVPPSSPLLRSAAMVLLWLLAEAFGRRYDRLTILMWIAIALLVWRPADLWSLGYQLSVGLTATLFWLAPRFHERVFGPRVRSDQPVPGPALVPKLWDHLKLAFSSGVLCCLVSVPLLMLRTGIVSPLAVLATLLVTPLIVVALWVGYIVLALGMIAPTLAAPLGVVLRFVIGAAVQVSEELAAMPWSAVRPPPVSVAWTFAATAAILAWARYGRFRDSRTWTGLALILVWLGIEWRRGGSPDAPLRIDTIAVGDGSCHLIRSGGDAIIWDCGTLSQAGAGLEIQRAVRALGVWRTPIVVITHPDIDHFGSLLDIIEPLGVRTVLVCPRFADQARDEPRGAAAFVLAELAARRVRVDAVHAGDSLPLGRAECRFLSPPETALWDKDNDHSLVGRFVVSTPRGERTLLMTGDIEDDAIHALRDAAPDLRADILELPHHGSAKPAAIDWTIALKPRVILQSTGHSRLHDARWDAARNGRDWFVTCRDGAAWAEIRGDGTIRSGAFRGAEHQR